MKNEIKEILDDLRKTADNTIFVVCSSQEELDKMPKYTANFLSINDRKAKILLDYITNLQKENFNLRENILIHKMSFKSDDKSLEHLINMPSYEELQQLEQEHKKINGELREENSKLEIALQNIQEDYDRRIEQINYLNEELEEELNEYKFPNCKTKDIEVVRANLVDMMRKNKRLEQENEKLKEENNNKAMNDYAHAIDESWYRELYDDYKSRCEKAIEYINVSIEEGNYFEDDIATDISEPTYDKYVNSNSLLNILQNGDDKE